MRLDSDTSMSPGSFEAVMRAAGGATAAVDEVIDRQGRQCLRRRRARPAITPRAATPMGFCLFNNAAIAARYAQKQHGAERVAIVDFDVHHGNGTSGHLLGRSDRCCTAPTHQMPLYPGTGAMSERGDQDTIVNAPLRPGDGGERFQGGHGDAHPAAAHRLRAGPHHHLGRLRRAHARPAREPATSSRPTFAWATQKLMEVADHRCNGRVVSLLEGGYDLEGLSRSVAAHVTALMRG